MKSGSIIIGILALAMLLAVLGQRNGGAASLPTRSQVEMGSALVAGETFHDFSSIRMRDGNVTTSFAVSNPTESDIRVDSIVTSCMCTTAYLIDGDRKAGPFGMPGHGNTVPRANEVIRAGRNTTIEVIFDPAAHGPLGVGVAERSIYLIDESGGALELKIRADVVI